MIGDRLSTDTSSTFFVHVRLMHVTPASERGRRLLNVALFRSLMSGNNTKLMLGCCAHRNDVNGDVSVLPPPMPEA
jgi:hypothetical protein